MAKYMSSETRFWSKVNKEGLVYKDLGNCWEWIGKRYKDGYGRLKINNKEVSSNRFSWKLHYGKIPKNLFVLHKCDNPKCVNPEHLFLGTKKDNTHDAKKKGRLKSLFESGENHKNSKLNKQQVREIRELYKTGDYKQIELACIFKVTSANIWHVIKNRSWKDI